LVLEQLRSALTDNFVCALTQLSVIVLGDDFPFHVAIQLQIPFIPVITEFCLSDFIYSFLTTTSKIGEIGADLHSEIVKILMKVLANPVQTAILSPRVRISF
jgi:hypothetical protein